MMRRKITFYTQILLFSISIRVIKSNTCKDDVNFRYGEDSSAGWGSTFEDDWGTPQTCTEWVALEKVERCKLEWEGKPLKEHCPTTCNLVRNANVFCDGDGKGMLLEKCVDEKWIPGTCIKQFDYCGVPCNVTDTERADEIMRKISNVFGDENLSESSSAQYLAYDWVVNEDKKKLCPNDNSLIQRYVMAVIFHQWGGKDWNSFAVSDITYLNEKSECLWHGVTCEDEKIIKLQLNEINARGKFVSEITHLQNLIELDIFDNYISGTIPSSIDNLKKMKKLDFDYNYLEGALPESLYKMTSLEWLDIDNNYFIGTLSEKIGQLTNLTTLSLFECRFVGNIPQSIGKLKKLESLSLDGNFFSGNITEETCFDLTVNGTMRHMSADCAGENPKVACECCSECF